MCSSSTLPFTEAIVRNKVIKMIFKTKGMDELERRRAGREALREELERRALEALEQVDLALRKCLVKDLLRRFLVAKAMNKLKSDNNARASVFKAPGVRRITRSMARTSTMQQQHQIESNKLVPSTPKISPFLPETPAALRKQKTNSATTNSTNNAIQKETADERRVLGSMISTSATAPEPILKMQLNDGTVVDVNLAADPSKVRMSLGEGMFGEVKRFLSNITKYAVNW